MQIETKDMALDMREATTSGEIEGYASLFGEVDNGGDIISPGAYGASLAAIEAAGRKVKMLWQHDPSQPIGVWDEIREDSKGLYVKGRLLLEVERAREAAALIENGAIDGLSIGYRTIRSAKDSNGNRVLSEIELWEVSIVTFPMLHTAKVRAIGGALNEITEKLKAGDRLTEREFETMLKGALDISNSQAERAARIHLKGQGEPAAAVQSGSDYLAALLALKS